MFCQGVKSFLFAHGRFDMRPWDKSSSRRYYRLFYAAFFIQSLSSRWFNRDFTNDDAFQQWFPLYEVLTPGRHAGDLVFQGMQAYLMPLHWWIAAGLTHLTRDPVMSAHWLTLIQYLLTGVFVWLAVYRLSSRVMAHAALLWLLHSRPVFERMAGGLPRGWMAPLCAATVWCLISARWKWALVVTGLAAFLAPIRKPRIAHRPQGVLSYKILTIKLL